MTEDRHAAEGTGEELFIFEDVEFEDVDAGALGTVTDDGELPEGFGDDIAYTQAVEACWSLGPLKVCASVVGSGGVRVSASLLGHTVLSGTLSPRRNRLCASPSIGIAKAQLCVVLDVRGRQVRVEGRLCIRRITLRWRCTNFGTRILSW